jgi:hypothetical protein
MSNATISAAAGDRGQRCSQLAVAQPAGLRQGRTGHEAEIKYIEIDRHIDRVTDRHELVDDRCGPSIDEIERGREPHPELAHAVDFFAFHVAEPKRGDAEDVRELGDPPQLARSGETGAVQLIPEVGVRVDVDHLDSTVGRHPSCEREADRVIPANRNQDAACPTIRFAASRIRAKLP